VCSLLRHAATAPRVQTHKVVGMIAAL
jgi:hypothetical protein